MYFIIFIINIVPYFEYTISKYEIQYLENIKNLFFDIDSI